jgi:hypothetical protein
VAARDYVRSLSTAPAYLELPAIAQGRGYGKILAVLPETGRDLCDLTVHLARRRDRYGYWQEESEGNAPMNPSHVYDADLHQPGTLAATGRCSWHGSDGPADGACAGEAVVSFQDRNGNWQSGCRLALEELVEGGDIEPLGQGA